MAKKKNKADLGKGLAALLKRIDTNCGTNCGCEAYNAEKVNNVSKDEIDLVKYCQQENLTPLELAFAYNQLKKDFSLSHDEIANRVSEKRSKILNHIRLLRLAPNIQDALRNKVITYMHAKILVRVEDVLLQQDLFNKVKEYDLSVRSTEILFYKYQ